MSAQARVNLMASASSSSNHLPGSQILVDVKRLYEESGLRRAIQEKTSERRVEILRFAADNSNPQSAGPAKASEISAGEKLKAFRWLGFAMKDPVVAPPDMHPEDLRQWLEGCNADSAVVAIIVQLPCRAELVEPIQNSLLPKKDIDDLSFPSAQSGCATADGICRVVDAFIGSGGTCQAEVVGAHGRVGQSTVKLLSQLHLAVGEIDEETGLKPVHDARIRQAEIVVTAASQQKIIGAQHLHAGHRLVVDCGFFPGLNGGNHVGNVDPAFRHLPKWITPVPGGMGPIEMAVLIERAAHLVGFSDWHWKLDGNPLLQGQPPSVSWA